MKTALPRRVVWLGAAIAAFAALAVWADGELDGTFGVAGVASIAFPNAPRAYLHAVQTRADGTIEAAGFAEPDGLPTAATPAPDILIARLSSTGTTLLSALTVSQAVNKAVINGPAGAVIASQTGDVFIVGSNAGGNGLLNATVYWLDSAGKVLASYARLGTGQADQSACPGFHPILDSQGRLVAACFYGDTNGTLQLAALRLSPRTTNYKGTITHKLVPDPTFGPNGFAIIATFPATYTFAGGTAITQDRNTGAYFVGGFACAGNCLTATANQPVAQFVARLGGADGMPDPSYGNAGFAVTFAPAATGGNPEDITLDNAGKVVIGGNFSTAGSVNGTGYVARLTAAGTRDSAFGTNGVVQGLTGSEVIAVRTDAINQVYALDHGTRLFRLTSSGAPDAGFTAAANVQTLNGAGSAWQTMQFVDANQLSVYIAGGASAACTMNCAASAVIAKVSLVTKATSTSVASDLNPSSDGSLVTFTASVSGLTGVSPGGNVTFKDGAAALGTVPLAAGVATFSTSALSVGYHNITAIYGGDANNSPSASPPLVQAVDASTVAPSTTALTLSPGTISVGQSVTLSATVTGTNPTGAVTFNEGTSALGTGLLVNGTATLGIDVLTVGSHDLIASYSGDVNNMPSDSALATVTVTMAASATALALTPATSTDGQSVTLTATVTGVAGLNPTGTVSFKDGTTALGTAALMMNGTATFSTSALSVGTHSLTAEYGGDGNFNPSTSAAVTAMVDAKPVTPGGSSGGGGGGGFGLLELCALLLVIESPSAMTCVPFASAKCTTYPPLEAKRWPGARVRRG
jgi:hypothetical protein